MATAIDQAAIPQQGAARPGIRAIAGTELIPVALPGLRLDAHRHEVPDVVVFAGLDLYGGEVLAVIQRELRMQQLPEIERVPLVIADVALHQRDVNDALVDGRGAKPVAGTG